MEETLNLNAFEAFQQRPKYGEVQQHRQISLPDRVSITTSLTRKGCSGLGTNSFVAVSVGIEADLLEQCRVRY